jgi:hydroxymethylpyrimidine pyrophosphatase-like HAD family hydrolase
VTFANEHILFACDIDDTLIRSWRKRRDSDVCIEYLDNKPQAYIASILAETFAKIKGCLCLLPVTTRSTEQYRRILWERIVPVQHAIISNGGIILGDDAVGHAWHEAIRPYLNEVLPAFEELTSVFEEVGAANRITDNLLMRVSASQLEAEQFIQMTAEYDSVLNRFTNGNTHYLSPKGITKEAALEFYLKEYPCELLLSAGDSLVDIPMLRMADISIVPNHMIGKELSKKVYICDTDDYPCYLADILYKLIFERKY